MSIFLRLSALISCFSLLHLQWFLSEQRRGGGDGSHELKFHSVASHAGPTPTDTKAFLRSVESPKASAAGAVVTAASPAAAASATASPAVRPPAPIATTPPAAAGAAAAAPVPTVAATSTLTRLLQELSRAADTVKESDLVGVDADMMVAQLTAEHMRLVDRVMALHQMQKKK